MLKVAKYTNILYGIIECKIKIDFNIFDNDRI